MAAFVEDIVLVFKLNGEEKTLAYRKLPFSVWSELKRQLGFTPSTILAGIADGDVEAVGALVWLERKQSQKDLRWSSVAREFEYGAWDLEPVRYIKDGVTFFEADEDAYPPAGVDTAPDPLER